MKLCIIRHNLKKTKEPSLTMFLVRQLNDAVTRKDSKAIENCLEKLELEARVRKELLQRYVEKLLAQNLKEKVAKENQLNGFKDENDEVKTRDNVSLDYQMLFWEDIEVSFSECRSCHFFMHVYLSTNVI